ncbi:MAG: hypothetical protein F6K09_01745 [Merismopedia sp. SIO2A8]|nr:hypothetical protein [Symploca sp. SIO2B6]NET47451.1 hypothetical protein [Merismopedia sp. SIO2A8]
MKNNLVKFGLVIVLILGIFTIFSGNAQASDFTYTKNIDYPSGDYWQRPNTGSTDDCNSYCNQSKACLTWSYDVDKNICFLKTLVPTPNERGAFYSSTIQFPYEVNIDRSGGDLQPAQTVSNPILDNCLTICKTKSACTTFTVQVLPENEGHCFIKGNVGNEPPRANPRAGFISGLRSNF